MKNIKFLRKILFQAVFVIATVFGAISCINKSKPDSNSELAEVNSGLKFLSPNSERDIQFITDAAQINLEQIKLGQLAQKKSSTAEIIKLGERMEISFGRFHKILELLAKKKSIGVPEDITANAQNNYKDLSADVGINFDKAYCNFVILRQKEAITMFEKAAVECTDLEIKQLAVSEIPNLSSHLNRALLCQSKL